MSKRLWLASCVLLAGCARYPEPYRPPMQRNPVEVGKGSKLSHFIAMNTPGAERHFVTGVLDLNDGNWRWCLKRAEFQFELPDARHKKLLAELTVPDITFEQTGPVKLEISINSHPLETLAFDKPGNRTFEKAVPPEWITPGTPVLVRLEIDKIWRSPTDQVERGFIITRLGFIE